MVCAIEWPIFKFSIIKLSRRNLKINAEDKRDFKTQKSLLKKSISIQLRGSKEGESERKEKMKDFRMG